jgi:putative ABC transport system permease protein
MHPILFTVIGFGARFKPIFRVGEDHWWVVVAYVLLMILVTAFESAGRARYYFKGMLGCVFLSLLVNVTATGLFAFGLIIKPQPVVWEPQYVIPIMGMILGTCINGISLSLNNLVTSLVENQSEIDLLLAFGANSAEASSRVVREAVRTGTMPMLNGMAVIGIVSIPGMMTGQILGGSPVMEAARYQMLIMYWIAISSFGCILTITFLVLRAAFDSSTDMLHREDSSNARNAVRFWTHFLHCGRTVYRVCRGKRQNQTNDEIQSLTDDIETTSYVIPRGKIHIRTLLSCPGGQISLDVSRLELSFPVANSNNRRVIFSDLSFSRR